MIAALDSNILIYWLDSQSQFHEQATNLLVSLIENGNTLVCSTLVAAELLSKTGIPSSIIADLPVEWQDVSLSIAESAGMLRQKYNLGLQDAIHIASAISSGAESFHTNDKQISKLDKIGGLKIKPLA